MKRIMMILVCISLTLMSFGPVISLSEPIKPNFYNEDGQKAPNAIETRYSPNKIIVDINGMGDHTTITSALENASDGDTIYVLEGEYQERLTINKSVSIIGAGSDITTINGIDKGDVITILADLVKISNIRIINFWGATGNKGILMNGFSNLTVKNCNISYCRSGLTISGDNNLIKNNIFTDNKDGIYLNGYGSKIIRNIFTTTIDDSICAENSDYTKPWNEVSYNYIKGGERGIRSTGKNILSHNSISYVTKDGMFIVSNSDGNYIRNNSLINNIEGIDVEGGYDSYIENNTVINSEYGIGLGTFGGARTLSGNVLLYNDRAIGLGFGNVDFFNQNFLYENDEGISFHISHNSNVFDNCIMNTTSWAIFITDFTQSPHYPSNNNLFFNNSFIDNDVEGQQVIADATANFWHNPTHGNYWSDYEAIYPAATNDGTFWDTPYSIAGEANALDNFSLVEIPTPEPQVAITSPIALTQFNNQVDINGISVGIIGSIQTVEISIDGGPWTTVSGTDNWEYLWDVSDVENGIYEITVRSYDGSRYSQTRSMDIEVKHPQVPKTPIIDPLQTPDYDGNFTLSWTNISERSFYILQESKEAGHSDWEIIEITDSCNYEARNREDGVYYYRIMVYTPEWKSDWSPILEHSVNYIPPQLPTAPIIIEHEGIVDDGNFMVNWTKIEDCTHYTLHESGSVDFLPYTNHTLSENQISFVEKPNGTYHFRVRANNQNGSSDWSNSISIVVKLKLPPRSPDTPILNDPGEIDHDGDYTLSWSKPPFGESYSLIESCVDTFQDVTEYNLTDTFKAITGKDNGTYWYKVRAHNQNGTSDWSNVVNITVQITNEEEPYLDPPTLESIPTPNDSGKFQLNWNIVSGASLYSVEEKISGIDNYTEIAKGPDNEILITNKDDGIYWYRVKALGAGYRDSNYSNEVSVVVEKKILGIPVLKEMGRTINTTQYIIRWTVVDGVSKYQFQESINDGFAEPSRDVETIENTIVIENEQDGKYYYRVRGISDGVRGPWSEIGWLMLELSVDSKDNTPPTITITSPKGGDVVSGVVKVKGSAIDDDPGDTISFVQIRFTSKNGSWTDASGTVDWAYDWNTTLYGNGIMSIQARCSDGTSLSNIAEISVEINNSKTDHSDIVDGTDDELKDDIDQINNETNGPIDNDPNDDTNQTDDDTDLTEEMILITIGPFQDQNGDPLKNKEITIVVNGHEYIAVTDDSGSVTVEIKKGDMGQDATVRFQTSNGTVEFSMVLETGEKPPDDIYSNEELIDDRANDIESKGSLTVPIILIVVLIVGILAVLLVSKKIKIPLLTDEKESADEDGNGSNDTTSDDKTIVKKITKKRSSKVKKDDDPDELGRVESKPPDKTS